MMFKSLLALIVICFQFHPDSGLQVDIADELAANFKQGNSKEIAKSFAPSIELIIVDQEDVYNRAQAEQILKDFFLKNPPIKTSIIHKLNNNNSKHRLTILSLSTKTDKFRVTITMRKTSNAFLITELRIEPER